MDADGRLLVPSPEAQMRRFQYRLRFRRDWPVQQGGIEATDEADALRRLRILFLTSQLPENLELQDQTEIDRRTIREKSNKIRQLLIYLRQHHQWLEGKVGARANFSSRDLRDLKLPRLPLSMADLSGCDLSDSDLTGSNLRGANLSGANLGGANLTNVDLSGADLIDANLNRADLTGAQLDGADVWRANFHGCTISLWDLHSVMRCRHPGSNLFAGVPA